MGKDRSARGIAIGVVAAALAGACGGKVDETPLRRTPANCLGMCTLIVEAKCGGDELTSCTSNCKAMPAGHCEAKLQTALDCAWYEADYACVDGGDRAAMFGCDLQWQTYLTCSATDGGS